jgi:phage baseplate assembly protein V
MSPHEDPHEQEPSWRRGIVTQRSAATGQVKVQFPDEDGMETDWLPVVTPFTLGARAFWLPRLTSQVVVLLDEHGEDGAVIGGIYTQADPPPGVDADVFLIQMDDGTTVSLDPTQKLVTVSTPGSIQAQAGGDIDATAGGNVNLQGANVLIKGQITLEGPVIATQTVAVAGSVEANGGITTSSGGAIPGNLDMAGTVQASDATLGGKQFSAHTHHAPNGNTSAPL